VGLWPAGPMLATADAEVLVLVALEQAPRQGR